MLIRIDGPNPEFSINAPNFTAEMARSGLCRAWFTVEQHNIEMQDDAIAAVRPRLGDDKLIAAPFGTAPRLGMSGNYPAVIHERDVLDHLVAKASWLDPFSFSLAVIATAEPDVKTAQNLAAIASSTRSLRLVRENKLFWLRAQSSEILVSEDEWSNAGPFLAIMSASDGHARLRISMGATKGETYSAEYEPDIPAPHCLVLGAEQVAEEAGRPTPSPPRSWRGASFEMLGFNQDILAPQNNTCLQILDRYFQKLYTTSK